MAELSIDETVTLAAGPGDVAQNCCHAALQARLQKTPAQTHQWSLVIQWKTTTGLSLQGQHPVSSCPAGAVPSDPWLPPRPPVPQTCRRLLRHNAIETWKTMLKIGWKWCSPPMWWAEVLLQQGNGSDESAWTRWAEHRIRGSSRNPLHWTGFGDVAGEFWIETGAVDGVSWILFFRKTGDFLWLRWKVERRAITIATVWMPFTGTSGAGWLGRSAAGGQTIQRQRSSSFRWSWLWCRWAPQTPAFAGFVWINSADNYQSNQIFKHQKEAINC